MKLLPVKKYVKYIRYDIITIIDTKVDDERTFGSLYAKDEEGYLYWGKKSFGEVEQYIQQGKILDEADSIGVQSDV